MPYYITILWGECTHNSVHLYLGLLQRHITQQSTNHDLHIPRGFGERVTRNNKRHRIGHDCNNVGLCLGNQSKS